MLVVQTHARVDSEKTLIVTKTRLLQKGVNRWPLTSSLDDFHLPLAL